MLDKIAAIGKLAARKYRRPVLLPPKKRRGSQSRRFKVRTKKEQREAREAMDEADGNVQSPHRYGRKKSKV